MTNEVLFFDLDQLRKLLEYNSKCLGIILEDCDRFGEIFLYRGIYTYLPMIDPPI